MAEHHKNCDSPPKEPPRKPRARARKPRKRQPACQQAADALKKLVDAKVGEPPSLEDLSALPWWVVEQVLDRIDAGYREGHFVMTCANYAGLLMCVAPDEFVIPAEPHEPTDTAPGSGGSILNANALKHPTPPSERVKVYAARCRAALSLWHAEDAKGDEFGRGIRPVWQGFGEAKTGGWEAEQGVGRKSSKTAKHRRRKRRKRAKS